MVRIKLFVLITLTLCLSVSASGQIFKIFKKKNKEKKVEKTVETPVIPATKVEIENPANVTPTPQNSNGSSSNSPDSNDTTANQPAEPKIRIIKNPDKEEDFRYRIGLLDQLQVEIYNHPELTKIYNVSENGTISIPRSTKTFTVLCKTESQVADEIKTEYKKFLRNPSVNVRVASQNSQPIAVIGAVEKPANFFINRKMTLLELIANAGGPKEGKAGTKVQIARIGGISGCSQNEETNPENDVKLIDNLFAYYRLKDVFENRQNPVMRPGDIVRVLERDEVYVIGNVKETTRAIEMRDSITVSQAIAAAGGLLPATQKNKVEIRRRENGQSLVIPVDLEKIEKREIADVELLPDDVVYVPTDKLRGFFQDVKKAVTQGLPTIVTRVP